MGGYFDIYKGLWIGVTGPHSVDVPVTTNHMVVNDDGSINTTGAPAPPSGSASMGIVPISSSALGNNLQIKSSPGNLYAFECTNATSTAGFVMLFNRTSVPADGAVTPTRVYEMPANSTLGRGFDPPDVFTIGVLILFSTTGPMTKTTPGAASCFFVGDVV